MQFIAGQLQNPMMKSDIGFRLIIEMGPGLILAEAGEQFPKCRHQHGLSSIAPHALQRRPDGDHLKELIDTFAG